LKNHPLSRKHGTTKMNQNKEMTRCYQLRAQSDDEE
jgi:hypothetical protein